MTFTISQDWPQESREAAQLVLDAHGDPDEVTETQLVWHRPGAWKRIIAAKEFHQHDFPAPHIDCVESVLDYQVPPEKATELALFDGSVMIDRTAGEISARCHDEQANFLALNLSHDIVTGSRTAREARAYYAEEFLNARRKGPTPYMEGLRFTPKNDTQDPDERVLSDEQLEQAVEQGKQQG
ncbi:hypothetical protein [Ornithinimicrobium murale]|uniref:hypothetical protein n=1 Tax=Ornithinimicrobium murale TaxID=1050153 RepID=UPI000E0DC1ED|nr:hypothetical protein [Ornithinimicrobium murale]